MGWKPRRAKHNRNHSNRPLSLATRIDLRKAGGKGARSGGVAVSLQRYVCLPSERKPWIVLVLLLQIADIVDSDDLTGCIANWVIASRIGLAQYIDIAEEGLTLRNIDDGFSLRV
jgi:hypothetical protein